jgi:hypothetical protein
MEIAVWFHGLAKDFDPKDGYLRIEGTKLFTRRQLMMPPDLLAEYKKFCPTSFDFMAEQAMEPTYLVRFEERNTDHPRYDPFYKWWAVLYAIFENEGQGIYFYLWRHDNERDSREP